MVSGMVWDVAERVYDMKVIESEKSRGLKESSSGGL